jgi:hypothetical protein
MSNKGVKGVNRVIHKTELNLSKRVIFSLYARIHPPDLVFRPLKGGYMTMR